MCERREARNAQDAAAEALTIACIDVCRNHIGVGLKKVFDDTVNEAIPERFKELLGRLQ